MEAGALIAEAGLWAQWLLLSLGPLLVYASVITVVHELGHALAARPAGYHLTSVGVGRGPRLLRLRLPNGVIVVLHAVLFAGGSCVAIPRDGEAGRRGAWFHAGGVLAQLALAGVLAAWPQRWWSQDLTDFNFVVLVWNLLPWQFHGQTSDGWWLLSRLWPAAIAARWPGEGAAGTVGSKGPAFARLAAVEQARGSPIGARYAALMQSWSALQRRELGLAEALAAGPRLAAGEGPPALRALEDYVGVEAARQGGAAAVGAGEGASAWVGAARARLAVQGGALEAARVALSGAAGEGDSLGLRSLATLELALAQNGVSEADLDAAAQACLSELRPSHADPLGARAALQAADRRLEGRLSARRRAIEAQPWLAELVAVSAPAEPAAG